MASLSDAGPRGSRIVVEFSLADEPDQAARWHQAAIALCERISDQCGQLLPQELRVVVSAAEGDHVHGPEPATSVTSMCGDSETGWTVEATLDTSDGDIRWGVCLLLWDAIVEVLDHSPGIPAEDSVATLKAALADFVSDPHLVDVFAGAQPDGPPEAAAWVTEEYVRVKQTTWSHRLAKIYPADGEVDDSSCCYAQLSRRYRYEFEEFNGRLPHDAWIQYEGHRLCLYGDVGRQLIHRYSLPVVEVDVRPGEEQVWLVDPVVVGRQWYDSECMFRPADQWTPQPMLTPCGVEGEKCWSTHPNKFSVPRLGWLAERPPVMASPEVGLFFNVACRDLLVRRDVAEAIMVASWGQIELVELDSQDILVC